MLKPVPLLAAALAAFLALPALAQDAAKAKAAAPASAAGKQLYPQSFYDFLIKQRTSQGQPDSPELRASVRDELNTRELLVREAKKQGFDKNADVKTEMDLTSQTVLVRALMADYLKTHKVSDEALHKEYDSIKAQLGDKEYKVRHILLENEADAKDVIAQLKKGEKFEKLAERSKDTGSKINGGDLDWNAPANFVKPFADAVVSTPKGKYTETPVQTQFGWHVIMVEDIRDAKIPSFDEVKQQLAQRMQGQVVEAYVKDLRAKNGL
jgi:peptidyl-prolyl cis-trans isomerase C